MGGRYSWLKLRRGAKLVGWLTRLPGSLAYPTRYAMMILFYTLYCQDKFAELILIASFSLSLLFQAA